MRPERVCATLAQAPRGLASGSIVAGTLEAGELHKLKTSQVEPAAESATTGYRPRLTGRTGP